MSFSTDVKDELARVEPECSTCAKAALSALIKAQGTLKLSGLGKYCVELATDNASIARFAIKYLHDIYDLDTELTMRRSVLHKATNYLIEIVQSNKLAKALADMGILDMSEDGTKYNNILQNIKDEFTQKDCCSASYLRGAFLGGGYISSPAGDFHFEITVESKQQAEGILDILTSKNINAKYYKRRNSHIVYMKSGQSITDFLAFTGAHKSALNIENVRVFKSIKNDEQRKANIEFANINRSSNAAVDQLFTIKKVVDHYGLDRLSPGLRQFIALRVKYQQASLKELGQHANPPLSKSAINGRIRRLEAMARDIDK